MKRLSLVLISLSLVVSGFLTSCTSDSTSTPPVISFTNDVESTTVTSGSNWTVTGNIASEAGLKEVRYFTVVGNSETQKGSAVTSFDDKNSFDFTVSLTNITETMSLKITALDKDDQEVSKSYTITVTASAGEINTYSAVLMGGQLNATNGSFLATTTGTVYKVADAKTNSDKVDVVYYYGTTNLATLAAPDDASAGTISELQLSAFTTKNTTRFAKSSVSSTDFAALTNDASIAALADPTGTSVTQLAVNDVLAFKTKAGKKGLILVKEITGTTGADRAIKIDVKVQK